MPMMMPDQITSGASSSCDASLSVIDNHRHNTQQRGLHANGVPDQALELTGSMRR